MTHYSVGQCVVLQLINHLHFAFQYGSRYSLKYPHLIHMLCGFVRVDQVDSAYDSQRE
jgi:hypothetical protein